MFRLTLEKTLNHLINTNNIDTERLNNKIIGISVDEFNLRLLFMFANSRVFVMEMHDQQNFDVNIKLNQIILLLSPLVSILLVLIKWFSVFSRVRRNILIKF